MPQRYKYQDMIEMIPKCGGGGSMTFSGECTPVFGCYVNLEKQPTYAISTVIVPICFQGNVTSTTQQQPSFGSINLKANFFSSALQMCRSRMVRCFQICRN